VREAGKIVTDEDVEAALKQYGRFMHREAWACQRKMPPQSMFDHDDLMAEATEQLVVCLRSFRPELNLKFITYYGKSLTNRLGRRLKEEWRRRGHLPSTSDEPVFATIKDLPEQEARAWVALNSDPAALREALGSTRVTLPDRYSKLRRPRLLRDAAGLEPPALDCADCVPDAPAPVAAVEEEAVRAVMVDPPALDCPCCAG